MKKSLVVLLIAVLALSAVFAADVAITATGEVEASYVFDFDAKTGTYNVPELEGELAWEVVLPLAKAGSQYPYINVAGEIDVDFTDDDEDYFSNGYLDFTPEVDFDTFEIVGEDWKIDFLADITSLDYAVSAIDTTWYAPKSKTYNVTTGRNVEANLTYRWLTDAEYVVDAVSFTKDGVGTITLAADGVNTDAGTKTTVTKYSVVYLADDAAVKKATAIVEAGTAYKNGVATTITYGAALEDLNVVRKLAKLTEASVLDIEAWEGLTSGVLSAANSADGASEGVLTGEPAVGYNVVKTVTRSGYAYDEMKFAVTAETEEIQLSDSITTQFGAGFAKLYENTDNGETDDKAELDSMKFGFSTKAAYENILSVAYDFGYDFSDSYVNEYGQTVAYGELGAKDRYSFDLTTAFKYEAVTVNVYLAYGQLYYYNAADLYKLSCYQYYTKDNTYGSGLLLSTKASVDVEEIGTKFTFVGKDLIGVAALSFEAKNTYFDNYTFTFSASTDDAKDYEYANEKEFAFKAETDYTEELGVTAYAGVTANLATPEDEGDTQVVFEAGVAYGVNGLDVSVDFISDVYRDRNYFDPSTKYGFTVAAGYEAEMFEIEGAVYYNTHETAAYKSSAWTLDEGLYVEAGISTDKLVDGATLSLEYESGELYGTPEYGTLTAACTVEF